MEETGVSVSVSPALHGGLGAEIGHEDGKEASPQEAAQGDRERDLKAEKGVKIGPNPACCDDAKHFLLTFKNKYQQNMSWLI